MLKRNIFVLVVTGGLLAMQAAQAAEHHVFPASESPNPSLRTNLDGRAASDLYARPSDADGSDVSRRWDSPFPWDNSKD